MDIVKDFKFEDFKMTRDYLKETDVSKLLKMLSETDDKSLIERSKIIKQLIYHCKHVYPDSKFPCHPEYQERAAYEYHGMVSCVYESEQQRDEYQKYFKSFMSSKEGDEDYDPSLYCSECGLDIRKKVSIESHISWIEHCSSVEGW